MENEFGKWLRSWREQKGLSTYHVAKLLNMSQSYVWKLEVGQAPPSLRFLRSFALVFNAPEVYLAAGRLVPEEVKKKLKKTSTLVEKAIEFYSDESSGFPATPLGDDPNLAKFMVSLYDILRQSRYTKRDLDFLLNMVVAYLNAKNDKK